MWCHRISLTRWYTTWKQSLFHCHVNEENWRNWINWRKYRIDLSSTCKWYLLFVNDNFVEKLVLKIVNRIYMLLGNNYFGNIFVEVITIKTLFTSANPSVIADCRGESRGLTLFPKPQKMIWRSSLAMHNIFRTLKSGMKKTSWS